MAKVETIHWLVNGVPQCDGYDGSGDKGVEIESPFDPNVLKLNCAYCLARFQAEASQ